jgi:hypothetical protein
VRVIGALREVPIYGGKCGVRRRRCGECRKVLGDVRSEPGTKYPTNSCVLHYQVQKLLHNRDPPLSRH